MRRDGAGVTERARGAMLADRCGKDSRFARCLHDSGNRIADPPDGRGDSIGNQAGRGVDIPERIDPIRPARGSRESIRRAVTGDQAMRCAVVDQVEDDEVADVDSASVAELDWDQVH